MSCARNLLLAALLAIAPLVGVRVAAGGAAAQSPGLDGRALAFDRGKGNCLSCHQIAGGDLAGTIGPPLADMKSRFPDRKELIAVVTDETTRNPQTVMPPFGRDLVLSDQEIQAIVDFLYTQ